MNTWSLAVSVPAYRVVDPTTAGHHSAAAIPIVTDRIDIVLNLYLGPGAES